MMTLDQGGDEGAMLYAQVGQHHLARATETSPKRSSGLLSCLSARPPDLADAARTRPRVVSVFLSTVPFVYSKRAAAARAPRLRYGQSFCRRYEHTSRGTTQARTSQPRKCRLRGRARAHRRRARERFY